MKKNRIEVFKRIGLLGLHRNSGVTHLTLLMAQYLSGCLGHKVTVFEKSGRFDLASLPNYYSVNEKWTDGFKLHGIQFLTKCNITENNDYKYKYKNSDKNGCVLIDFGTNYKEVMEVKEKLDIVVFVFMNAPWYQAEELLLRYMTDDKTQFKKAAICNMATKRSLTHGLKLPIKPSVLGLEPVCFNPSAEAICLFESMLRM
ncbi:hypothetical protein [Lachnoclostridium sp.]|uniref:hypothetical protein n=1 Tax=Lachnoclostridium sp. TaxID=2028282 RepID=UPI002897F3E8|nr:hypothetical protein [Lachnoclostridium sp.]